MIKRAAITVMADSQEKMMANAAMLEFYCQQICVKHEASSLLSVVVEYMGDEKNLEEMADVYFPDECDDDLDKIYVIPKDNMYLSSVIEALFKAHPEFKLDIFSQGSPNEEKDESKTVRMGGGFVTREDKEEAKTNSETDNDVKIYIVRLTMPPVDSDRRDLYHDCVDKFYDGTKMKIDALKAKMKVQVAPKVVGYTDDELKEVDDKIEELYNQALDEAKRIRKEKDEEIEWGYQRYVERHPEEANAAKSSPKPAPAPAVNKQETPETNYHPTQFGSSSSSSNNRNDDKERTQSLKL